MVKYREVPFPTVGLIFDKGAVGREGVGVRKPDTPSPTDAIPKGIAREKSLPLPDVAEVDLVRHYTFLSRNNFGIDMGFYPLGSCTMKYNPKVNDALASLPAIAGAHPAAPPAQMGGVLGMMWELEEMLSEITGMKHINLQPAAGAHGELTGMLVFRSYFNDRGETGRTVMLIPDSAHGTNPASASIAGFSIQPVPSDAQGLVTPENIAKKIAEIGAEKIGGLMLTNPNTLGLFEKHITQVAKVVHDAGGLLYYDGANLNALLSIARPGDMGFDLIHVNTHKSFSTPHGGGGPGAGPVGVNDKLLDFLPNPRLVKSEGGFAFDTYPKSIGRMKSFFGNFLVLVRTYVYLKMLGADGLRRVSENAIINANYIQARLKDKFRVPYLRYCMHEFVASASEQKKKGVRANDIAKHLLEMGMHAPTVYFPLIVEEAMMIEPTETEGKAMLDYFCDVMNAMAEEIDADPERFLKEPLCLLISHPDDAKAARHPDVRWVPPET